MPSSPPPAQQIDSTTDQAGLTPAGPEPLSWGAALRRRSVDPHLLGMALSLGAAGLYTVTNICTRVVVAQDVLWVTLLKIVPMAPIAIVGIVASRLRGTHFVLPARVGAALACAALVSHWGGNVLFQYGLTRIGLAVTVPLCFGALLLSGAIQGQWLLGERVRLSSIVGMFALVGSIALLSLGAADEPPPVPSPEVVPSLGRWLFDVGAVILSGVSFSIMGTTMRWSVGQHVSPVVAILIVGLVGIVSLSCGTLWSIGLEGMRATPPFEVGLILVAGVLNALAFFLVGLAFKLAPVVQVNAANSSQTAMAAVAGVLLFQEQASLSLVLGTILTLFGLYCIQRRD